MKDSTTTFLALPERAPSSCIGHHDLDDQDKAVFDGCWDWHSSVHAHWAILRAARQGVPEAAADARIVAERLSRENLVRIGRDLETAPQFERPYGRAWFLRLTSEFTAWAHEQGAADPDRLRALGDAVADGLLTFYKSHPANALQADGYHNDNWAMTQLLDYYQATGDSARRRQALDLVSARFLPAQVTWSRTNDETDPSAFLSVYWSWLDLLATAESAQTVVDRLDPAALAALAPDTIVAADPAAGIVHPFGLVWSRAWAIKHVARRVAEARGPDDPIARELTAASEAHVEFGRQTDEAQRGDYKGYDHWVPQFAIYALTE